MMWSGFILGLLGSMHCIGMCGPIALIIPVNRESQFTRIAGSLVYNLGRIMIYALLGMFMGGLGKLVEMSGFQKTLTIVLGSSIIIIALTGLIFGKRMVTFNPMLNVFNFFKERLNRLIRNKTYASLFSIGMINAFLPCGLLYLALVGAATLSGAFEGFIYMGLFGLGTLPVMFLIPLLGHYLNFSFRNKILKLIPFMMILFGLLLILRGLDLGIPFLSPAMSASSGSINCH